LAIEKLALIQLHDSQQNAHRQQLLIL